MTTEEKKPRRAKIPFAERLAAMDLRIKSKRADVYELERKRDQMIEAQRKVVAVLSDELPPEPPPVAVREERR